MKPPVGRDGLGLALWGWVMSRMIHL